MDRVARITALCSLWILLLGVGCSGKYEPEPPVSLVPPTPNTSIATLLERFPTGPIEIKEELVVCGRVVSSDQAGNFYHRLIIQQEQAALEIKIGLETLHARYPIGCKVTLRLQELSLDREYGLLQVGKMQPSYDYPTIGDIESQVVVDQHVFRSGEPQEIKPLLRKIDQLSKDLCGCLVMIEDLHYAPLETTSSPEEHATWQGYRRFTDQQGNVIHTTVSSYARFANQEVPNEEQTLCGVLLYLSQGAHQGFVLKPRDEQDWNQKMGPNSL